MMAIRTLLLAVLTAAVVCVEGQTPTPTDDYTHDAMLDDLGKYHLYWKFNDTSVTFEVHAETLGYVGFGISPNGGMANSDIVIGWVKDGQTYLTDRFASSNSEPAIDDSQDYDLIGGMETETHTVLTFSRPLRTCDADDNDVTSGTLRLIYAYHADDPVSETGLSYHGSNRGTRSIHVIGAVVAEPEMPTGNDLLTYEFLNPNISVPHNQDTTYWCQAFKLPSLGQKHHMIKYEPIIQEGHEALVHHILIYQCHSQVDDGYHGFGHECYSPNMPENLTNCEAVIVSWAIGGGGFYLPEDAGFSLGEIENGDPDFVIMETHYDNPDLVDTFVDSSGIRIYYTPVLREHDAAILTIGTPVEIFHVIPPHAPGFKTTGYCSPACLDEGLTETNEITVFASLLHAHLAGTGVRTRHIRNGVEQPLVAADDTYDFNFQEMRHLEEPITVQQGDTLVTECTYNTQDRTSPTYAGLGTTEEMCLSFLYYYPRIPVATCESFAPFELSLTAICGGSEVSINYGSYPPTVTTPGICAGKNIFEILEEQDWTNSVRNAFESKYDIGYVITCEKTNLEDSAANEEFELVSQISEPLINTDTTCAADAIHQKYPWICVTIAIVCALFSTCLRV